MDSGLNSVVLANNDEMILLPINEPTYGTKRKSQIQTYLEQNNVRMLCVVCCGCTIPSSCIAAALRVRVTDFFCRLYCLACLCVCTCRFGEQGEGVQHMALMTSDIFRTLRQMRQATPFGGFEFHDAQPGEGAG